MARTARPRRQPGLAAALTLLAWLAGCAGEPPRILLLITVDTLRADYLGAYGSERGLTPRLDALARESLVFSAAYAPAAFTLPSVSALLTGRYPQELGIWSNESALPEWAPTLAAELRHRGWWTAAVVSNWVLRASSGLARGFDRYEDDFPQTEVARGWPERTAASATDALLRLLDACGEQAGADCFLWIHYQDPHGPYTPPPGRRERQLARERAAPDGARVLPIAPGERGLGALPRYQVVDGQREVAFYRAGYAGEVQYVDEQIGRLLAGLVERGAEGRTTIVFAADHGEGLGENDYWFAHGEYLSDPLVRVPLFIRVPGEPPGRRGDVASLVDVFPTLLSLAGGEGAEAALAGRDLLAIGGSEQASVPYLATLGGAKVPRYGVVEGEFKLVLSEREGVWDARLARRDREGVDLTGAAPQVVSRLRERLNALRDRFARGVAETRQALTPEDLATLRSLGYVVDPEADPADAQAR
ncbi:MAG: sulfatase [Myxococcota bacterium]